MYILRIDCEDLLGVVSAVSTCLSNAQCNIEESSQFHDKLSNRFFMRVVYSPLYDNANEIFCKNFSEIAKRFSMKWDISNNCFPVKTLIMVSKQDHCLHDLLYRWKSGNLPIDITGVVSNHEKCRELVESHGISYHVLPITSETKLAQEEKLSKIINDTESELIVMARYMQVLSEGFCQKYSRRIINIHHSFLPSFKGARPYEQAYKRGVKIIGATAHFATNDLDEGPIIEQETVRISHYDNLKKLQVIGQDTEKNVLAKAINLYADHRIFFCAKRTVIL